MNPQELTPEELSSIEEHNKLLAIFSKVIEQMMAAHPDTNFPVTLMYAMFILGASAVSRAHEYTGRQVAKDIDDMRRVYALQQAGVQSDETN